MKKLVLGGMVAAALVAAPVIAQMERPDPNAQVKRGDVESRVKTFFDKVDSNHDGYITQDEAKAFRASAHEKMADAMFSRLDANKDGSISRDEFDAAHNRMAQRGDAGQRDPKGPLGMHRGMRGRGMGMGGPGFGLFQRADADKDGKVSLAEAVAGPLQKFDSADANHDGVLTPEERKAARDAMRAQWKQRRSQG